MPPETRALLATALLALLIATAGCSDGSDAVPPDAPPAAALQENATAAMRNVSTTSFTMDMRVETGQGNLSMDAAGVMDLPARKMRMEATVEAAGRSAEVTQYVIDGTLYQRVEGTWQTRDVSDQDVWERGNRLALQRQLLNGSDVEITDSGTVDGHDVWIVSIEPDGETVRQLLERSGTGVSENLELGSVEIRQYVDADTAHVRKIEMDMDATVQGQSATLALTMTFSGFDEPVDVRLPEDAPQPRPQSVSATSR